MRILQSILRLPRYYFLRVKRLKGDPEYLARGVALGVFMGNLPFVPQTVLLIPITIALRCSTMAAIIASVIANNPLTVIPQYYIAWKIGNAILPGRCEWEQLRAVMESLDNFGLLEGLTSLTGLGMETLAVLLLGGAVMGLPLAAASYFAALRFFRGIRARRLKKHRLDKEQ